MSLLLRDLIRREAKRIGLLACLIRAPLREGGAGVEPIATTPSLRLERSVIHVEILALTLGVVKRG